MPAQAQHAAASLPRDQFRSLANLRDLGGHVGADGRRVRPGLLYRSSALDAVADDERPALAALALRKVCDFRTDAEREAAPFVPPENWQARTVTLAIGGDTSRGTDFRSRIMSGAVGADEYRSMLYDLYRSYVRTHAGTFRTLFVHLLDDASYPVLFHCSAGKDRTGIAAALILTALGVSRDDVLGDFLLTNERWNGDSPFARAAPAALRPVIGKADETYLIAAFEAAEEDHGSLDAFLADGLGLDHLKRAELQRLLLD